MDNPIWILWIAFSIIGTAEMTLAMSGRTPRSFARIALAQERVPVLDGRQPSAKRGYRDEGREARPFPYAALPVRVVVDDLSVVREEEQKSYRLWLPNSIRRQRGMPFFAVLELHDEGDAVRVEARFAPFAVSGVLGLPAMAAAQLAGILPTHPLLAPPVLGLFTVVMIGWNIASYLKARRAFARVVAALAGDIQRAAAPRVGPL